MLYIASANDASRAGLRQPEVRPIEILNANSFAHGKFAPYELARMAAAWIDGRVLLTPTTELASQIFHNVSRRLIREERRELTPASLPLGMLAYGWQKSSLYERDAFCRQHEAGIWKALEVVADCQR